MKNFWQVGKSFMFYDILLMNFHFIELRREVAPPDYSNFKFTSGKKAICIITLEENCNFIF